MSTRIAVTRRKQELGGLGRAVDGSSEGETFVNALTSFGLDHGRGPKLEFAVSASCGATAWRACGSLRWASGSGAPPASVETRSSWVRNTRVSLAVQDMAGEALVAFQDGGRGGVMTVVAVLGQSRPVLQSDVALSSLSHIHSDCKIKIPAIAQSCKASHQSVWQR